MKFTGCVELFLDESCCYSEEDYYNRTDLSVNGEVVWPSSPDENGICFDPKKISEGDIVEISIPSGTLSGKVAGTRHEDFGVKVFPPLPALLIQRNFTILGVRLNKNRDTWSRS